MSGLLEMFREGGHWSVAILALFVVGGAFGVGCTVFRAMGRRVPLALWLLFPVLIAVAASLGVAWGGIQVQEVLTSASPDIRYKLLARGIALSLTVAVLGGAMVAILSIGSALGAGLGAVVAPGPAAKMTGSSAALVAVLGGVSGAALVVLGLGEPGAGTLLLAVSLFFGTIGLTLAAMRASSDPEHLDRAAADRAGVGTMVVVGMLATTVMLHAHSSAELFSALAATTADTRMELMAYGLELADQVTLVGALGAGSAALMTAIAMIPAFRHAFGKRNLALAGAAVVLLGLAGGAMVVASQITVDTDELFKPIEVKGVEIDLPSSEP